MKLSERKELQLQLNETPVNFSMVIDDIVQEKHCTHIEAVLLYCNDNDVEPDQVIGLISPTLKAKIELEASQAKLIKQQYRPAMLPE